MSPDADASGACALSGVGAKSNLAGCVGAAASSGADAGADAAEDAPNRILYNWLLGEEGQRLVAQEGYVSILEVEP